MNDDTLALGSEFPAASRDDWLKLVRAALKDRPFERLTSKTYDGLTIEPLYGRAAGALPVAGRAPGAAWTLMQRVDHPDPALANAEALHDLANGTTGLSLVFAGAIGAYGYGLPPEPGAIARALDGIHLDAIAIELDIAEPSKHAADHLAVLLQQQQQQQHGIPPERLNVRFGHDAIGAHAFSGSLPFPWRQLGPLFAGHVAGLAKLGFKRTLATADGRLIHAAGGSEAQELAYMVAVAVEYLRMLEAAGVALDEARDMISFRLSADADQFLTIAKFRAVRQLWARAEQACGLPPTRAHVSAETAWRMMTKRDPWVNTLRTTIAAFSAGLGGADAITVLPHTAALGLPDRFARRIARNTQLILLEESNLAKVADPVAGSGAIEDLTGKLCAAAWTLFQEFERAGGVGAAVEQGLVQQKVAAVRAAREAAVAHRRDALTGTTDYPDLAELPATVLDVRPLAAKPAPVAAISFPALPRVRLAEPFELLRDASDAIRAKTGVRPKVFLANLGTLPEFTARATFARNFFEAGGIEAVTNDGFVSAAKGATDLSALVAAFKASAARLACLCSSDERYGQEAEAAAKALTAAGAAVMFAGRPGEQEKILRAADVEAFIFAGCDAIAALRNAYARIAS